MVKMRHALAGAAVLVAGWLVLLGYAAAWQAPAFYEKLGTAAMDWGLAGLATACYSQAADIRTDADAQSLKDAVHDNLVAARILLTTGRPHAALSFAESASRISPGDSAAEAWVWRMRYLCATRAEAKRQLRLLVVQTDEPEAVVALAACLADESRLQSARALLEKALQKNPRCAAGWLELARVFRLQDNRTNALRAAVKAHQSAENQPSVRTRAAQTILAVGAKKTGYIIAGRSLDYWYHAAAYRVTTHRGLLVVIGVYLVFIFWPAIAGGLKSGRRPDSI
ncbi:MAG: hypothetical protein R6V19_10995 [Armatimonadota bacterium]